MIPLNRRTVAKRVLRHSARTVRSWVGGIQWWVKVLLLLPVVGTAGLAVKGRVPPALVGVGAILAILAAVGEAVYLTVCDYAAHGRTDTGTTTLPQPREDHEALAHRDRLAGFVGDLRQLNLFEVANLAAMPEVHQLGEHIADSAWGGQLLATIRDARAAITFEEELRDSAHQLVEAWVSTRKLGVDTPAIIAQWLFYACMFGEDFSFHTERESDGLFHVCLKGRPGSGHIAAASEWRAAELRRACTRVYTTVRQWSEWDEALSRRRTTLDTWKTVVEERPDRDVLRNWLRHSECDACRRDLPRIAA